MPQDLEYQELQAKLFECTEELKISKKSVKELEWLKKENQQLQTEKLSLQERLQRAADRISFLEEEQVYWNNYVHGAKLVEEAAEADIKKLKSTIEELKRQLSVSRATNEELEKSIKVKDQQLSDQEKAFNIAQESAAAKRKALEENILAMKKVNAKLEEALQHRNSLPNEPNSNSH